jgi:histidine triad (HIT) family protein
MTFCLFCKVVSGEAAATIVDRTETTVAFHDMYPVAPTHVLVIPTVHVETLNEALAVDPQIVADLFAQCARIAEMQGVADAYRVVVNNGSAASQAVHHLHAHVLGGRDFTWPPG